MYLENIENIESHCFYKTITNARLLIVICNF
jgi:hypothetical protein